MTRTMPLLSLESAIMLCRVDPRSNGVFAWASSFVDGRAPWVLRQKVAESRVSPFTPVDGSVASL